MGERNRLRALQVRVSGHYGIQMLFRRFAAGGNQFTAQRDQAVDLSGEIHTDIQRHLIIAAPAGVQPLARVADTLRKLPFHKGMYVFRSHVDGERARLNVGEYSSESFDNGFAVALRNDAHLAQHGGMGEGTGNILLNHTGIKADGGIQFVEFIVNLSAHASCPKFHGNLLSRKRGSSSGRPRICVCSEIS